jgi:hypothetical protein
MASEKPFGDVSAELLHRWMFGERDKHKAEIDALTSAGAFIMGRNMFGPKYLQPDDNWKGWCGAKPPFHAPVFVLSHTEREPIPMVRRVS